MKTAESAPIVLIHGFIGDLKMDDDAWRDRPHAVIAPDLLGYGENAGVDPAGITLVAQAEHIAAIARSRFEDRPVHVVGHSVGGAVSALMADLYPRQVASLINVEGNFTLRDAFWSGGVGRMSEPEAAAMLAGFQADAAGWLTRAGLEPTSQNRAVAERWLANQPASTLTAMGRSVVQTTGAHAYNEMLKSVFARTPVHLVAGERSRQDWNVPDWAMQAAASTHVLPGCGHMMMLEDPLGFCAAVSSIVEHHA